MTAPPPVGSATDDTLRSPGGIALTALVAAALCLLPAIPAVRAVLGVGPRDVALALGGFLVVMIASAVVYRAGPARRLYAVWDRVETVLTQAAVLSLVYASGRGDSFFWLPALVHVMIVGGYGTHVRFNAALFATMPALTAVAFVVGRGDAGVAALSLGVGAIGCYIYWLSLSVSRRLAAVDAERARLAAALAETRVHEDRERIARDIHDGVGADLAALDWRLRGLRGDGASAALRGEVDELVGRLAHGSNELRTIVWALRTPSRRWSELVAYLRQRAAELCGDAIALEVVDKGDGGTAERSGEHALGYLRAVLELVHNAVRHAGARRLRLVVRAGAAGLEATVEDDGRGLPADALDRAEGGLANLRQRVARAGGELEVATRPGGGTRVQLALRAGRPAA